MEVLGTWLRSRDVSRHRPLFEADMDNRSSRRPLDKLSSPEKKKLEAAISAGVSWRQLERDYGVPQSTLRFYARRNGIDRLSALKAPGKATATRPSFGDEL